VCLWVLFVAQPGTVTPWFGTKDSHDEQLVFNAVRVQEDWVQLRSMLGISSGFWNLATLQHCETGPAPPFFRRPTETNPT
jgi:hypothetical protein